MNQTLIPDMSSRYRILFVCLGNICRSPAAEIVCRAALKKAGLQSRVEVDSCGTASYHVGSRPDRRMIAALQRAGYEYDGHRARTLRRADGSDFDLIVPQDRENLRDVTALLTPAARAQVVPMSHWFPEGCRHVEVPDPYYGSDADFDEVVQLDLRYIDNWSLSLDIKILFQTVFVVLFHKGSK